MTWQTINDGPLSLPLCFLHLLNVVVVDSCQLCVIDQLNLRLVGARRPTRVRPYQATDSAIYIIFRTTNAVRSHYVFSVKKVTPELKLCPQKKAKEVGQARPLQAEKAGFLSSPTLQG
jgi:hypothetical protein